MRKYYLAVLFLALSTTIISQLPVAQSAAVMPSTYYYPGGEYNNGRSVAVDQQGNVYSVGLFFHTVDFDPGPGAFILSAGSMYNSGIFISKLGPNGQFVWAKQLPVMVEFSDIELEVDSSGNVYVTSNFNTPADMDPGPGVQIITPIGGKDVFVMKLTTDGNLVWVKQFGGPGDTVAETMGIDIDGNGNVYTSGIFINTVDFDPGTGTANLSTSNHWDGFISKLNSNGDFVWVKRIGNFSATQGSVGMRRIQTDASGNCFFSGTFAGNCDFDPGSGQFLLASSGLMDGFIASLDANGNFRWARQVGNSALNYYVNHHSIAIDAHDNVYTSGSFIGTQDFDPGPNTTILSAPGGTIPYLLKLDQQGNFVWAKKIPVKGTGSGADVTVDNTGNIYTTGNYIGDVDFGPGPGITSFTGLYDETILTKFSPNGDLMYAAPFLRGAAGGYSLGRRLVSDNALNLYIAGFMYGTVDFDPGPAVLDATIFGESPYVLKLGRCKNVTASTVKVSTCDAYNLNGESYDSSGTYVQTIQNVSGCDSVITLQLTVNRKFSEQSKTICEGTSFFAAGANQTKTGTYVDTLRSVLGCDSIVTTRLLVNSKPAPSLGADRNICAGTTLTLSPGAFSTYLWQDGTTQNNFTITAPGAYFVTVANAFDCTATDTIHINAVIPLPKDFLPAMDSVCSFDPIKVVPSGNYSTYLWSTGSAQETIDVDKPGNYWLKVRDANGCFGMDTIIVLSKQCMMGVYIPTAFTPDGNGRNDVFKAIIFGHPKSFRLQVFDRWGELIFETSDPAKGWDGSAKAKINQTTVFGWACYYQFDKEAVTTKKGTVVLIR